MKPSNTKTSVYSKRWLGRHFILTKAALKWGRYSITDADFQNAPSQQWESVASILREADPELIASKFELLLREFVFDAYQDFLAETDALCTYELSKKHLSALRRVKCEPDELTAAKENVAAKFQHALLAVFNSATQIHCQGRAHMVRYSQILHGSYLADVFVQDKLVRAAFSQDLRLESIWDDCGMWPPIYM